ncbi:MAG: hypothetical protein A3G33_01630 [Omnitrophica bacterium RIFCSPLOWO2_12_FULL_44_17]|uniref:1-acyl-sn-glycerol-3-phosphate acyltransferase n=1 Tax=Candidatus Danuiimicrobium aquiferis TaxID=1801832 RepID=A0A1G1KVA7_9BACT|nr:MAG: hypothetical protein A3B72_00865 [Omnitrophica bacterium RIFCSPHIGHO2_02_FULL_45_28]OGW92510.1 MAG: hypothetical protein A3E74_09325 [Omnitrophica bacterium RIFCSPHIGHO2_12_FULL_44_12]OGW96815.1 MAG: hypothetical protein A3G33_01630 [Omnitrophica bacterium RIFCSPLOWO2_12_FULL_44_17]
MMKKIFRFLYAVWNWAMLAVATLIVFILIVLLSPFDREQKLTYHIANFWGKFLIAINPAWDIRVTQAHHIKKNKGYVLVANHTSLADIVLLYSLGKHFKWVAKSSLFKIPFFGWTMSLLNYIPLKRGKHGSVRDSFKECQMWLEKNISVLLFPEGTRSASGKLGAFKNGSFKLAILTQKPIIPIVIKWAQKAIKKGEKTLNLEVQADVKVLAEIPTKGLAENDFEELKHRIWNLMNQELTTT